MGGGFLSIKPMPMTTWKTLERVRAYVKNSHRAHSSANSRLKLG
jgi:hypothetical protein